MIDLSQLTEEQLKELELQIQQHKEQQKVKDALENLWDFVFTIDDYGTVGVDYNEVSGKNTIIHIPKDCIQHFIDALEQLK